MDVLLETGAVRPDEGAMSVFQQALAGLWAAEADQPKTATRNSLFTAFQSLGQHYPKRRGPVNQFRPSLEDLGPRELSAFPVNPLGASMAGAASVSIVVVASPTAPLTPSQPAATAGAWDFRNDLADCGGVSRRSFRHGSGLDRRPAGVRRRRWASPA